MYECEFVAATHPLVLLQHTQVAWMMGVITGFIWGRHNKTETDICVFLFASLMLQPTLHSLEEKRFPLATGAAQKNEHRDLIKRASLYSHVLIHIAAQFLANETIALVDMGEEAIEQVRTHYACTQRALHNPNP